MPALKESAELPPLLPERIERAFRQERALIEDPDGSLSIDEALAAIAAEEDAPTNGTSEPEPEATPEPEAASPPPKKRRRSRKRS